MSDNPWVSREASERITREIEKEDRELADKKRSGQITRIAWHPNHQQPLTEQEFLKESKKGI
jgi:hypothetical protein